MANENNFGIEVGEINGGHINVSSTIHNKNINVSNKWQPTTTKLILNEKTKYKYSEAYITELPFKKMIKTWGSLFAAIVTIAFEHSDILASILTPLGNFANVITILLTIIAGGFFFIFIYFIAIYKSKNVELEIANNSNKIKKEEALFVIDRYVERDENGDFVTYEMTGPCTYPNCKGKIKIVTAPPREANNRAMVGICTNGQRQHSYSVDYNYIACPREFNWNPPEPLR